MIAMTLAQIASVCDGVVTDAAPSLVVGGSFVIDSRTAGPGDVFVAVVGERVDGHSFAGAAVSAGAVAVLGTRPVPGVPCVVVPDVVAALAALARHVLSRLPEVTIAGITGSSGKTSTKDLAYQLVSRLGPCVAPAGSFNTEYGLPLTILRCTLDTRYLVLEMSARGAGHIAYLCGIAPPTVGVVLNVGHAHAGEFGSIEAVALAKGELVEALPPSGIAILNADDPRVAAMASRTRARVVTFGTALSIAADAPAPVDAPAPAHAPAPVDAPAPAHRGISAPHTPPEGERWSTFTLDDPDVRAEDVRLDSLGRARFTLVTPEGSAAVALRVHGAHQVPNALAAAALARTLGLPLAQIAAGLSGAEARSRWRMEVTERPDGVTVINDAYNANPESMRAALDALGHLAAGGRAFAVLGYMAELGSFAPAAHRDVGEYAARSGVACLFAVGAGAAPLLDGARSVASWDGAALAAASAEQAVELLRNQLKPCDVVLVKASRAVGLEAAAAALLSESSA